MAKSKKDESNFSFTEKLDKDGMLYKKTNEDYNDEKPLASNPNLKAKDKKDQKKEKTKIYTCSSHPKVQSEKPGICPKCGLKLIIKK